jgi:hypothetical protein
MTPIRDESFSGNQEQPQSDEAVYTSPKASVPPHTHG